MNLYYKSQLNQTWEYLDIEQKVLIVSAHLQTHNNCNPSWIWMIKNYFEKNKDVIFFNKKWSELSCSFLRSFLISKILIAIFFHVLFCSMNAVRLPSWSRWRSSTSMMGSWACRCWRISWWQTANVPQALVDPAIDRHRPMLTRIRCKWRKDENRYGFNGM